jgi:xylulokinase
MYLGLDLGTSGLKALLIDAHQQVIDSVTAPLSVSRLHPGWSEQNPADWIAAAETTLDTLKQSHPAKLAAVRGIGLSGQMHGATLLDQSGKVLRPCILWNDTRSHTQAAVLDADPRFRQISGNIVFPGFTAPKLLWVKENEPDVFARTARVLLPKDYLRYWLTGEYVAEMSDAAGTSWLDTGGRCWSKDLLDACGMNLDQMPRLVEGTEVSGTLRKPLAQRWGLHESVVVAGGAGDNAASAVGTGTVASGSAFVSLGTSGVVFAATDRYLPNPDSAVHAFCHALPNTWHQMGVILSAAAALDWYARLVGARPEELTSALGNQVAPPGSVTFLPYLSGERTPHNDAAIRGVFTGLAHESDRNALTRAVLEGVAFALRDNLEALRVAGTELSGLIAVGGGSRSRYWLGVIANVLQLPVHVPEEGDFGAAFGAARLGLIAATGNDPLTVCTAPDIAETIEPNTNLVETFEQAYSRYRALYPAISRISV